MTDITKKQKTLFEQAAEGRKIMTEIFNGYEIRFLDEDGERWTPLLDIYRATGISKDVANKISRRIKSNYPQCVKEFTRDVWGETAPNLRSLKMTALNGEGLSLFFSEVHVEKIQSEHIKSTIRAFQMWLAGLVKGVLSGETEKATASLLEHAYDKVDIRVNPIGDVLEQHLKVAKLLSDARNADYSVMVAVAITETEKDTGRSLQEYQKLLPPVDVLDIGYLTPTRLAEVCGFKSNQQVNKVLEMMGFQEKRGKDWYAINEGVHHSKMYPYSNRGHSGFQIKWRESVVPLIEKFSMCLY